MKYTKKDLLDLGVKNSDTYLEWLNYYSEKFEVNTIQRITGFMMNLLHESGNFNFVEELSSGDQYDTRVDLGNTPQKDGDGRKFKGRGLAQITGKKNYRLFTEWCKKGNYTDINFVLYPEKLKEPKWAVLSAFWFWEINKLYLYADKEQFIEIAGIWNAGRPDAKKINGISDRFNKKERISNWIKELVLKEL